MIIYTDIISGDEIISDSYGLVETGDGIAYEADCAMITVGGESFNTGANASAEEADEGVEDTSAKVNNIIHSFQLQKTQFDKKGYLTYLKGYMKAVKAALIEAGKSDEEVKKFETGAQAFVKGTILPKFKDWEFYTGQNMNPDAMVILLNYRDDGTTPYVVVWKHGLKGTKV